MGRMRLERSTEQESCVARIGRCGRREPRQPSREAAACPSYSQILAATDELSVLPITVLTGVSYK